MGLSAHHGMKHGGRIDWSKVKRTRQSADDCGSTNDTLPILEATVNGRKVLVRVTPEPLLEAAKGVEVRVILGGKSLEGDNYKDSAVNDESNAIDRATENRIKKHEGWQARELFHRDIEEMALQRDGGGGCRTAGKSPRLCVCASSSALTRIIENVKGGVTLCSSALSAHLSRSMVQAEAMCTLAEIAWACPALGFQTVTEGCLDLVVSGMTAHTEDGMVQLHGLGYLRALSYDPASCKKLSKGPILMCAVDAIRNQEQSQEVKCLCGRLGESTVCLVLAIVLGCVDPSITSMFLQNMTGVSQSSTVKCILKQAKNDERPKVLPALIAMTKSNSTDTSSGQYFWPVDKRFSAQ
ncbi:hypothetical protein THAOC_28422 [Thalassiosira oceanica]|uniref:Uncharacterized protein n=1 Tax=Thalassiosira oceanica TaxID=159749 RepID=K0RF35_THAOC|nr:hypothetical protein THAOC_28422 [Thalassiosira oceanica]|eukprot:EJK52318.1 hypothetical protein THAOC_28422 [Thalassiosira oceanica]